MRAGEDFDVDRLVLQVDRAGGGDEAVFVLDDGGLEGGQAVPEGDVRGETARADVFRVVLVFGRPDQQHFADVEASAFDDELLCFAVGGPEASFACGCGGGFAEAGAREGDVKAAIQRAAHDVACADLAEGDVLERTGRLRDCRILRAVDANLRVQIARAGFHECPLELQDAVAQRALEGDGADADGGVDDLFGDEADVGVDGGEA